MSPHHQSQLYERLTKPYATYTATGDVIIGRSGKVYPRNSVLDVLRMFGLNVIIEDLAEVEKRKILKEYNDLKYEQDKEIYKLRKEIVLENWEQLSITSTLAPITFFPPSTIAITTFLLTCSIT